MRELYEEYGLDTNTQAFTGAVLTIFVYSYILHSLLLFQSYPVVDVSLVDAHTNPRDTFFFIQS